MQGATGEGEARAAWRVPTESRESGWLLHNNTRGHDTTGYCVTVSTEFTDYAYKFD